jgi:hypothetical protein
MLRSVDSIFGCTLSGLSDIGGICTKKRASINKEGGSFRSTQTAAHELGHK